MGNVQIRIHGKGDKTRYNPLPSEVIPHLDSSFPEGLHCHVFRHIIGMAMYRVGIPISYIKDFLGHASLDSTAIYAYADNDALEVELRSVDQDALPEKGNEGNIISLPQKKWKGKEEYLTVDELDAGIFEYLLGELLKVISEKGKGQLIFTSHNLRPLETIDKGFIAFTTVNPENRYIRFVNVKEGTITCGISITVT